jgi:hypothetical protein
MKQFILAAVFVLGLSSISRAQLTVYSYKQPFIKGVNNTAGNTTAANDAVYNYLLYVASPDDITVTHVWIGGKLYSVKTVAVDKLPVSVNTGHDNAMMTLVPATTGKVWLLDVKAEQEDAIKKKSCLKKKIKKNELVIAWKAGGKTKYKKIKNIKTLEAQTGV